MRVQWDLFVSHASEDVAKAEALVHSLEARGLTCWMAPMSIPIGADYAEAIIEGIKSSRGMIILLSPDALESRNVIREVERAHFLNLPLLTVRLQDTELSGALEYFLASRQFVDGFPSIEHRADEIAEVVAGVLPPTDGHHELPTPLPAPAVAERSRIALDRRWIAALASLAVVVIIVAFLATGGDDGADPIDVSAPSTAVETTTTATAATSEPDGDAVTVIGPAEVGAYDQNWFWVTAPDDAVVIYEYEGTEYETTEFWLRPDATGPGSFEVRVVIGDAEVVREVEFVAVDRPVEERTCHLLTVAEMLELLNVEFLQRVQPEVGANVCDWNYTTPAGQGTVEVAWHRAESGTARLEWFITGLGASPIDTTQPYTVHRGELDGIVVLMADAGHGLIEVSFPADLDGGEQRALKVLDRALDRTDPAVSAPAVGCTLLTPREIAILIDVDVREFRTGDPQTCTYQSDDSGVLISTWLFEGTDPGSLDSILAQGLPIESVEIVELEGLGDRALLAETPLISTVIALDDGRSVQIGVGSLSGSVNERSPAEAAQLLAAAALDLL